VRIVVIGYKVIVRLDFLWLNTERRSHDDQHSLA
jgi:hypothetical protein